MSGFIQSIFSIVRSKLFVKLLLEFLPLGLFLIAVDIEGIYVGSAVLAVTTLISMAVVWAIYRQMALMAIITGLTGIVAASATVLMVDPMWVKLKPTIVSAVFGGILAFGLIMGKPLLRPLIGEDLNLTDQGWRVVTRRWMFYFFFVALLNEVVWRGTEAYYGHGALADQVWATFKVVFLMPFTVVFAALMLPLLTRYRDDASRPLGGGNLFAKGSKPEHIDASHSGAPPLQQRLAVAPAPGNPRIR